MTGKMDGSLWARIQRVLICINNYFGCSPASLGSRNVQRITRHMHDSFTTLMLSNGLLIILSNLTDCNDVGTQSFLPLLPL